MPGVVQVVVLEFKGVSSSSKPSAQSLKVSMGKRQYQIWDKGEFSFPITRLREDLVIALMDALGNEIARADIKTMEIIEKGYWDNVFSINGSGHVHMKLQFVLNEDEKNRIRVMRESALKKKSMMEQNINRRLVDTTLLASAALQRSMNNEQKDIDSQKNVVQRNVTKPTEETSEASSSFASDAFSISRQKLEERIMSKRPIQDTERLLDTSHGMLGVKRDLPQEQNAVPAKKIDNQLVHLRADTVVSDSQSCSASENVSTSSEQKYVSTKKIPSKVWKLVSSFEDTRFQPQETGLMNSEREVKILKKPSIETARTEQEEKAVDISKESTSETAMHSEGMISEQWHVPEVDKLSSEMFPHESSASGSGKRKEISLESTTTTLVQDAWCTNTEECCSTQSSGMRVFPDNSMRLCTTTSMPVLETGKLHIESSDHPNNNLYQAEREHKLQDERYSTEDITEAASRIPEDAQNMKSDGSEGDPNGLFKQVIKIAVILGFGAIVLLTREKEPRKKSTTEKEKLFPISDHQWDE